MADFIDLLANNKPREAGKSFADTLRMAKYFPQGQESPRVSFNQQYHIDTLNQGKELINPDGSITTAMVKGLQLGDKIYNVPFYDRENKRIMSEDEARAYWSPFIQSGEIKGHPLRWEGDIKDHPANVQARKEHRMMDITTNEDNITTFMDALP